MAATEEVKIIITAVDKASRALSGISSKLKSLGSRMQSIGAKMSLAMAPVGLALGYAAKSAIDYDRALKELQARTTITSDQMKQLDATIKALAKTNSDSFKDIAAVVTMLTQKFGFLGARTQETAQAMLDYAKITGEDVLQATQSITTAMKAFNVPAEQAVDVIDTLIAAKQKYGVTTSRLIMLLENNAASLTALGLNYKQSIALLAAMEQNGVNVARAMMGIRMAATKFKSPAEFRKALEDLAKIENQTLRTRKATEIFGAYAGPGIAKILEGGIEKLDAYVKGLQNVEGTTKKASATIDKSLSERLKVGS